MKLYTFSMPFMGTQEVWLSAESEEEAWRMVRDGDWEDSEEQSLSSETGSAVLIDTEDYDEEESK